MMDSEFRTEWITAARSGDQDAIANLYNCAYQNVHIVIRSMLRADEDTVLDLLQDTFIKAFQRLDQLDKPEKYQAWVKQIARNTVLDHLKKSNAILFSELHDDNSIPIEIEDEDLSHLPDVVMDKQETARLLREIVDALPEGQRVVISMHYLQGIPVKEIADILGSKENTVKAQLRNGRMNLEKKIRELEKKENIKLYSLSPLPFLLLLLRNMEATPMQPDAAILGNILSSTSGTAAGSAAAAAAGSTAKAAGSAAAKGLLGKIAASIAAATLCGGAVGMYVSSTRPNAEIPTETTQRVVEITAQVKIENQMESSMYSTLITDYSAVIRGEIPVEQASVDLSRYDYSCTPYGSYVDGDGYFVVRADVDYVFAEYDINDDGTSELILLEGTQSEDGKWSGPIVDIFTFLEGQPVWLISGEERGTLDICEGGYIRLIGSGGADTHGYYFYEILGDQVIICTTAESDRSTYMVGYNACSKEEFERTIEQYVPISEPDYKLVAVIEP